MLLTVYVNWDKASFHTHRPPHPTPPALFCFWVFLAALGLRCCAPAFSNCGEWGLLFVVVHGLLTEMASLVVEHGL